jgi:hypothetical protein
MHRRHLILGAVRGYRFDVLAPFVNSLRSTRYAGDVVFLDFGGIDEATREALQGAGVRLEPVADPVLADDGILHITAARFLAYREFLRAHASEYARVLVTDLRDVVFQADPFLADTGPSLACFLEHGDVTIAEQAHNARWIHNCYGPPGLERVGRFPIICSGTTMGPVEAMLGYLGRLSQEALTIRSRQLLVFGDDQGMHNHLIWTRQLDDVHLFPNGRGNVLTLAIVPQERIRFDAVGRLLNDDGTLPAVVHQYDRFPLLTALLGARYGLASPGAAQSA